MALRRGPSQSVRPNRIPNEITDGANVDSGSKRESTLLLFVKELRSSLDDPLAPCSPEKLGTSRGVPKSRCVQET